MIGMDQTPARTASLCRMISGFFFGLVLVAGEFATAKPAMAQTVPLVAAIETAMAKHDDQGVLAVIKSHQKNCIGVKTEDRDGQDEFWDTKTCPALKKVRFLGFPLSGVNSHNDDVLDDDVTLSFVGDLASFASAFAKTVGSTAVCSTGYCKVRGPRGLLDISSSGQIIFFSNHWY